VMVADNKIYPPFICIIDFIDRFDAAIQCDNQ